MKNKHAINPLTSLRGIGAIWVYLYHCQFLTSENVFFSEIVKRGYFGVDIFFILSGFIISYIHLDEFKSFTNLKKNAKGFFILRMARIYPLHIFTILVIFFLQFLGLFGTVRANIPDLIQNIFLIQSWGLSEKTSWNIPAWSISVEFLLYLLFPFLGLFIGTKAKDILSNLLLISLSICLWRIYFYATNLNISWMHEPGLSIPRGILDFTIGIALFNLYRLKFLEKFNWDIISVLTVIAFLTVISLKSHGIIIHDIYIIPLCTLLVYSFANIKTFCHYLFSNKVMVYLGTISYSFYMFHWLYVLVIGIYKKHLFTEFSFFTWQFAMMTLGLVAISSLSFYLIENPTRKFIRKFV